MTCPDAVRKVAIRAYLINKWISKAKSSGTITLAELNRMDELSKAASDYVSRCKEVYGE